MSCSHRSYHTLFGTFGPNSDIWIHGGGLLSVGIMHTRMQLKAPGHLIPEIEQAITSRAKYQNQLYLKDYNQHKSVNFNVQDRGQKQARRNIENEIAVMVLCSSSDHIVRLHDIYEPKPKEGKDQKQKSPPIFPVLRMERVGDGTTLQQLLEKDGKISEYLAKSCIRDILRALSVLHELGIAHLDLWPQKVLLVNGCIGGGVKLYGFRLARMVQRGTFTNRVLTVNTDYKAPEILQLRPVSLATDIWSVGVMAYVMLMGILPFRGPIYNHTLMNMVEHRNPTGCPSKFADRLNGLMSPEAIDFLVQCTIVWDPRNRLTVAQCLEHPWLATNVPMDSMLLTLADACETARYQQSRQELSPVGGFSKLRELADVCSSFLAASEQPPCDPVTTESAAEGETSCHGMSGRPHNKRTHDQTTTAEKRKRRHLHVE